MEKCIRVCADLNQLKRCKNDLETARNSVHSMAKLLNLAGNEVRFNILYLLYKEEKMCPCDLSDVLNMTFPAVSQHLKKLWESGLLDKVKSGKTIFYSLNKNAAELILPIFVEISKNKPVEILH